ncbi:MAG TPA: hypothetical protein VI078_16230 [bacterium]
METRIIVRARTTDAKFIGTSMGGARVTIRRADTGAVLASGLTQGATGDTRRILTEPPPRGQPITDLTTAAFEARLDLEEPTFVTVEVSGPMGHPRSAASSTIQAWLIPGKHVLGDGFVVEIHGFVVAIARPGAGETVALADGKARVPLAASVVMM